MSNIKLDKLQAQKAAAAAVAGHDGLATAHHLHAMTLPSGGTLTGGVYSY